MCNICVFAHEHWKTGYKWIPMTNTICKDMSFSKTEVDNYKKFIKGHTRHYITLEFSHTGIGTWMKLHCSCGKSKEIHDVSRW